MKYKINDLQIEMGHNHTLEKYQIMYPLYDKFLPHLAKYLEGGVIDVGANVGALMASMAGANQKLNFVCIEADNCTYLTLRENAQLVRERYACDVVLVNEKVTQARSLSLIVNEFHRTHIGLIKVDVDGMDWDVFNGWDWHVKPPLFFEMDFRNPVQHVEYERMLEQMVDEQYTYFFLFDNFGEFVMRTTSIGTIKELMQYQARMQNRGHKTIYYFDVLACTVGDIPNIMTAVADYIGEN